MKRRLFEPLEIETYSTDVYPLPSHSHTYYEIIYIFKGNGKHHLNKLVVPYKAGDLFLISPDNEHFFEISKTTRFCFIKFTDSLFQEQHEPPGGRTLDLAPIAIMKNAHLKEEKISIPDSYKGLLKTLIENMSVYNGMQELSHSPLLYHQLLAIFGLIVETNLQHEKQQDIIVFDKDHLIYYIHQHIYNPERIRIKNISKEFNIASTYFSAYFKRNFETPYKQYIDEYRAKLIESRIKSGRMTLKQIADEFGFTDESHLAHFLKRWKKLTPANLRKYWKTQSQGN